VKTSEQPREFRQGRAGKDPPGGHQHKEAVPQGQDSTFAQEVPEASGGVGEGGVEGVAERVEEDGDRPRPDRAESGREDLNGPEDEERVGDVPKPEHGHRHEKTTEAGRQGSGALPEADRPFRTGLHRFADTPAQSRHSEKTGHHRNEEDVPEMRDQEEQGRQERANHGAGGVHRPVETEGPAVKAPRNRGCQHRVARGVAKTAAEPGHHADDQDLRPADRPVEEAFEGRQQVANDCGRFSPPDAVGVPAGKKLDRACRHIGDALYHPEGGRRRPDGPEKRRKERCGHLVSGVAEKAGDAHVQHIPVQPSLP